MSFVADKLVKVFPGVRALDEATLARTVAIYIASPANPQGAVASREYLSRLKTLADRLGHRQIEVRDRLIGKVAEPVEGEDRFDHHRAAKQEAELDRRQRDYRHERIA